MKMQWIMDLWTGETPVGRAWSLLLVVLLAVIIRIAAAWDAYPIPGDGAHFVQYGVELANGNRNALSTYWSQGMTLTAAAACRFGWHPGRVLQGLSVLAGVVTVLAGMVLAHGLFGAWNRAVLAGLLMATNPTMIQYSIFGYSEMPYIALMICSATFMWWAMTAGTRRVWRITTGAVLLGASVYLKSPDGVAVAGALLLCAVVRMAVRHQWREWRLTLLAALVFLLVVAPLVVFTHARTGMWAPGLKGLQLALGDSWADSTKVYALEQTWSAEEGFLREHGALRFLLRYRADVMTRTAKHAADSVRIVADQIFPGPLRLGPAWFLLLVLGMIVIAWRRRRLHLWLMPALAGGVPLVLICLCLVHARLVVPSLALFLVVAADGMCLLGSSLPRNRWWSASMALILALFLFNGTRLGLGAVRYEWAYGRYANLVRLGEALRQWGGDDDILMANGPHLAVHFYRERPLRAVELPCASIAETEAYALDRSVTLVVLSDGFRPHWPITQLFHGEPAPANWVLLAEIDCPAEEKTGNVAERYRVYRRGSS